ncbi:hypothetical protein ACFQ10_24030 [Streptomyces indonesiensis]
MTTHTSGSGPRRRTLLAATALAASGVGAAQPRAVAAPAARRVRLTLPVPSGPYPVGTVSHRLVDHG